MKVREKIKGIHTKITIFVYLMRSSRTSVVSSARSMPFPCLHSFLLARSILLALLTTYHLPCCCDEQNQYIQQDYAVDHLPCEDQALRLRRPGENRTWRAKLRIRNKVKGTVYEICNGWKNFVNDNNLQDGDLCLFQPLRSEELTMIVYIIPRD